VVCVDEVAGKHILGLRVEQPSLALQISEARQSKPFTLSSKLHSIDNRDCRGTGEVRIQALRMPTIGWIG